MHKILGQAHRSFLRVEMTEVYIEISSAIMDIKTLKDAELVTRNGRRGVWNIILNFTTQYLDSEAG
jgi:hypothetical protein